MEQAIIKKIDANTDTDTALRILKDDGAVILTGAVTQEVMTTLHAELNPVFNQAKFCKGIFYGEKTKRIHSLIAKSKACQKMALQEKIISIMQGVLGSYCDKIQINLTQGIQIYPGEDAQVPHKDDSMFGEFVHNCEFMVNALWAYSEFTKENGATFVVPGSHKWQDKTRIPTPDETAYAEMRAGDVLIYLGSAIHGGGANRTQLPRTAIVLSYSLGWLRQSENQYLAVPLNIARTLPKALQDLLGYCVQRPNLGMYEGNEPNIIFQDIDITSLETSDWLKPDQYEQIEVFKKASLASPYLAA